MHVVLAGGGGGMEAEDFARQEVVARQIALAAQHDYWNVGPHLVARWERGEKPDMMTRWRKLILTVRDWSIWLVVGGALIALDLLLSACGEPREGPPEQNLPGPVVELPVDQVVEPRALELVERLRFGLEDSRYFFSHVADVAVAASGEIFVLDPVNAEVVRLDSVGSLLGTLGRRGNGPGEFGDPRHLALCADTVFVLDTDYLHAFSLDGDVFYSQRVDRPGEGVTPLDDMAWTGQKLVGFARTLLPRDMANGDTHTDSIVVHVRSTGTGQFEDLGLRLEGLTRHQTGPGLYTMTLFSGIGAVDVTAEGQIVYAQGGPYRLDVYDSDGRLLKHVTASVPRKEVDAESRARLIERALAHLERDPHAPASSAGDYRAVPNAPWRAVLGRLVAGDSGHVLVERMDVTPEHPLPWVERESTWDLLDLGGAIHGRVTLPAGFRPFAFRDGSLYGAEFAGLIPTVVRYDLVEAAGQP